MSIDAHGRCSRAIRSLRFDWIQNPETILTERLQTVGLRSEYLKSDPELFEVFRKKLYCKLNKRHQRLIDLIVPIHFVKQIKIIWNMLKGKPIKPRKILIQHQSLEKTLLPEKLLESSLSIPDPNN